MAMAISCNCLEFSKLHLPPFALRQNQINIRRSTKGGVRYKDSKDDNGNISKKEKNESGNVAQRLHSNAYRLKQNHLWRGGFSLGIDLGNARTGVAVSKGYAPRPVTVLELRGQKLDHRLIELAEKEEADEFIIGLPKSSDGKENTQTNKVRSFAGRLAVRAAERGWRVYLQNEHGTSQDALDFMIEIGSTKRARQEQLDAYAAVMLLHRYFSMVGCETELVLPKDIALQQKLCQGPSKSPFDDYEEFDDVFSNFV